MDLTKPVGGSSVSVGSVAVDDEEVAEGCGIEDRREFGVMNRILRMIE